MKKRPHGLFLFFISYTFLKSQTFEDKIVSEIVFEGNIKTKNFILFREIHHPLNEPVDTVLIGKDRNRIENLGIFSDVRWELIPLKDGNLILKYKLVESPQSTPPTIFPVYNESKGWSLSAVWLFNNFQGRNQILVLSGSIGAEDTYGIVFKDPWILSDRISFSMDIQKNFYKNRFLNSDIELNRVEFGLGKWLNHKIKTETSLASESKIFKFGKEKFKYKYYDTFINIKYDTRDIFWNPGEGILLSGAFNYMRGYDFKNFQTLIWDQTLSFYVKLKGLQKKTVFAFNGSFKKKIGYKSIFFQDYLGGSNTIRGWPIPDPKIYKSEPFRFGHDYFHTSMELRYEAIPKFLTKAGIESGLSIVLFTDNGFMIKNSEPEPILFGSGLGIRIPFPILGVLRFDFGLGVLNYEVKNSSFHFGIGHKF